MPYADYTFYTSVYGGTAIPEQEYLRYSVQADAYLDVLTLERLQQSDTVPQAAQMAACAVADCCKEYTPIQAEAASALKSESVDGFSVSYKGAGQVDADCAAAMQRAVSVFLPRSHPLRYLGCGGGFG